MAIYPAARFADPFDQLISGVLGGQRAGGGNALMRAPETDVVETERELRVVTEMPGLKRENIEVDVENNVLTIRGEKREERTEGQSHGKYHLAERRYGTFSRSFVLPRDVDADGIQASFEDGVLTVSIPKSEKARRRRIDIGAHMATAQVGNGNAEGHEGGNG